mmetsp:Transcript_36445/g.114663  ORF Transcript_36445/g.114663 Transcript_36445/m.114663 type:complete len:505 (+) Transcript_36445:46-1560(+)
MSEPEPPIAARHTRERHTRHATLQTHLQHRTELAVACELSPHIPALLSSFRHHTLRRVASLSDSLIPWSTACRRVVCTSAPRHASSSTLALGHHARPLQCEPGLGRNVVAGRVNLLNHSVRRVPDTPPRDHVLAPQQQHASGCREDDAKDDGDAVRPGLGEIAAPLGAAGLLLRTRTAAAAHQMREERAARPLHLGARNLPEEGDLRRLLAEAVPVREQRSRVRQVEAAPADGVRRRERVDASHPRLEPRPVLSAECARRGPKLAERVGAVAALGDVARGGGKVDGIVEEGHPHKGAARGGLPVRLESLQHALHARLARGRIPTAGYQPRAAAGPNLPPPVRLPRRVGARCEASRRLLLAQCGERLLVAEPEVRVREDRHLPARQRRRRGGGGAARSRKGDLSGAAAEVERAHLAELGGREPLRRDQQLVHRQPAKDALVLARQGAEQRALGLEGSVRPDRREERVVDDLRRLGRHEPHPRRRSQQHLGARLLCARHDARSKVE